MAENENLKIDHVKKIFQIKDTSFEVLTDINLKIRAGEFISIVGASGCGKSTLARMIAGLEKPTDGEIWIGEILNWSGSKILKRHCRGSCPEACSSGSALQEH